MKKIVLAGVLGTLATAAMAQAPTWDEAMREYNRQGGYSSPLTADEQNRKNEAEGLWQRQRDRGMISPPAPVYIEPQPRWGIDAAPNRRR